MKKLIAAVLVIGVLLLGACAPASTSEPRIPAQEIEAGWIRIAIAIIYLTQDTGVVELKYV